MSIKKLLLEAKFEEMFNEVIDLKCKKLLKVFYVSIAGSVYFPCLY